MIWIKQEFYFVIKTENLHLLTDCWISPGRTLWSVLTWSGVNSLFIHFIHSITIQYLSPHHMPHIFKVLGMLLWPRYINCLFSWNLFLVQGSTESVAHYTSNSRPRMAIDFQLLYLYSKQQGRIKGIFLNIHITQCLLA